MSLMSTIFGFSRTETVLLLADRLREKPSPGLISLLLSYMRCIESCEAVNVPLSPPISFSICFSVIFDYLILYQEVSEG